jgi:hypothetical protein
MRRYCDNNQRRHSWKEFFPSSCRPREPTPMLSGSQTHRRFAIRNQCACKIMHLDPRTSNGSSIPILQSAGR